MRIQIKPGDTVIIADPDSPYKGKTGEARRVYADGEILVFVNITPKHIHGLIFEGHLLDKQELAA